MAILLIIAVIFLVLMLGMLLAFIFSRLDRTVTNTRADMAAEERAYNPRVTLGHRIKVDSDYEEQLKQARLEAAKKAAALPRGANSRVGRAGQSTLATAGESVKDDPMTAVRIARFHGWDGARTGIPSGGIPAGGVAPAVAAATSGSPTAAAPTIPPPNLINITPDMPPEEVRKARIANSKAEATYNKALKAAASGSPVVAPSTAPAAVPSTAPAAAPAAASIAPPKLIEITPDMAPEDVRKARVANAKAEAAYNKALKAAGGTPGAAPQAVTAVPPVPAAAQPPAEPAAAGIQPPQLIEITDAMSPEEIRRARVANAKAESAYNKALKAAGIDPAAAKAGGVTPALAAAAPVDEAAQTISEASEPPTPTTPAARTPPGIEPPKLIEITDALSPEEVRRARVENAKATAAYNKALKAAGIDPASLK